MTDTAFAPIRYRDFYDVPRAFLVRSPQGVYFFDCPFDDARDEYPDEFAVYRLGGRVDGFPDPEDWSALPSHGRLIGHVPVSEVRFDETRRAGIDPSVFDLLEGDT